jgi:hypothetical protein
MRTPTEVKCRRCSCSTWTQYTTTALTVDTEKGTTNPDNYIKREFRCQNCDIKATVSQHHTLESVVVSKASA